MSTCAVIGDIGGTNARFAIVFDQQPGWHHEQTLAVRDHPSLADALTAYLGGLSLPSAPSRAALCVACPVLGDQVALTNSPWTFSQQALRQQMGWDRLTVVNDFVGNALACPHLTAADRVSIGEGSSVAGFPVAVLGPGTGLGVALLVPTPDSHWLPVATEGGHVTLAARTDDEADILARIRADLRAKGQDDHVSAEHLLCGSGLALLHQTLSGMENALAPAEVTARALAGSDPHAQQALTLFCSFLGSVAGNLALSSGALGGVVLMGGILPRILPFFQASPFRAAFEDKGRFRSYLHDVRCDVVVHPYPALVGLRGVIG
ncbi:glucokinase [Insolitispirillum peregrinum]|uniref:Glucokinase n=1 Tax=Insolitispirillum peregrinum TaxID=80876 RepID=A0A1N7IHR6_9PROT|nr:glucokinase [Insolitispirillum peregrinum]SIS36654.1 glucokinase [Insolitispirillum peregrinum]